MSDELKTTCAICEKALRQVKKGEIIITRPQGEPVDAGTWVHADRKLDQQHPARPLPVAADAALEKQMYPPPVATEKPKSDVADADAPSIFETR